ncbi:hypothetical protein PENSPDRAFT_682083 [Peniophora sp. CONT]|nr:hypothetical protein PENSPDRAFT_682083 [Peniophora sp. CONT]
MSPGHTPSFARHWPSLDSLAPRAGWIPTTALIEHELLEKQMLTYLNDGPIGFRMTVAILRLAKISKTVVALEIIFLSVVTNPALRTVEEPRAFQKLANWLQVVKGETLQHYRAEGIDREIYTRLKEGWSIRLPYNVTALEMVYVRLELLILKRALESTKQNAQHDHVQFWRKIWRLQGGAPRWGLKSGWLALNFDLREEALRDIGQALISSPTLNDPISTSLNHTTQLDPLVLIETCVNHLLISARTGTCPYVSHDDALEPSIITAKIPQTEDKLVENLEKLVGNALDRCLRFDMPVAETMALVEALIPMEKTYDVRMRM